MTITKTTYDFSKYFDRALYCEAKSILETEASFEAGYDRLMQIWLHEAQPITRLSIWPLVCRHCQGNSTPKIFAKFMTKGAMKLVEDDRGKNLSTEEHEAYRVWITLSTEDWKVLRQALCEE